jgi:hypothetical protein
MHEPILCRNGMRRHVAPGPHVGGSVLRPRPRGGAATTGCAVYWARPQGNLWTMGRVVFAIFLQTGR